MKNRMRIRKWLHLVFISREYSDEYDDSYEEYEEEEEKEEKEKEEKLERKKPKVEQVSTLTVDVRLYLAFHYRNLVIYRLFV